MARTFFCIFRLFLSLRSRLLSGEAGEAICSEGWSDGDGDGVGFHIW
ncbi:MAG: hypothetical protein MPK07_00545 [Alphaproteobacteria bacterium]|nr:hypothetical protein [Alphaproteobacteria bacterium]MDA8012411.1 hypothetical protein [Alphaproteobacteria bacterium]